MINELFERELQNTSINGVSLADYIKDNYIAKDHGEWIPVSERLPEDRKWCLAIFKESDTGWINPIPYICDYVGKATKATTKEYWILHGFTDRDDEHIDYYFNLECVAWMPLPEPYRTEQEPTDWHGKYSDDEQAYKAFAKEYINRSQTESEDKIGKLKEM